QVEPRLNRLVRSGLWWPLVIALLALGLAWSAAARVPPEATTNGAPPPSPREGFSAPDFRLPLRAGDDVSLLDLRGQVVVLNLWASWCGPCRAEMPALERAHQALQAEGLVVLGLNTTFQDDETAALAFADELGLTFPLALDRTGDVSRRYELRAMPTTFFVDRRGVIRSVVVGGPMSEALIRSRVEELLAEAP
ncbi:MAG: TlpA family protein disulfide reductase, partial [Anaerolineales bacterium]|nr:TlpA family protein disulfide reductase [Anaerolineales bacterium]